MRQCIVMMRSVTIHAKMGTARNLTSVHAKRVGRVRPVRWLFVYPPARMETVLSQTCVHVNRAGKDLNAKTLFVPSVTVYMGNALLQTPALVIQDGLYQTQARPASRLFVTTPFVTKGSLTLESWLFPAQAKIAIYDRSFWTSHTYTTYSREECLLPNNCTSMCFINPPYCGNHGKCIDRNKCRCHEGWFGIQCTTPVCNPACVHGACVLHNTCQCDPGWSGADCASAVCTEGCVNGDCVLPQTCICQPGWQSVACDVLDCLEGYDVTGIPNDYGCINGGQCIGPHQCNCTYGWAGTNCEVPVCIPPCQNEGQCVLPDICNCTEEWEGYACQLRIVPPVDLIADNETFILIAAGAFGSITLMAIAWQLRMRVDRQNIKKFLNTAYDTESEDDEMNTVLVPEGPGEGASTEATTLKSV